MHRLCVVCTGHQALGDEIIMEEVMTVTTEERRARHREYMREWRRRNPEKERQYHCNRDPEREKVYRLNARRRKYLAELLEAMGNGQSIAT